MVNIKLAGIPLGLHHRFPELLELCKDYVTDEPPVREIRVSPKDLEQERECQPGDYSDGYLETVCLYRQLAHTLLDFDVFLLHASVVEVDGCGYAFLASSGTGKTTQTRLWLEHFGHRARIINGDKPLIRAVPHENGWEFMACGTPWCGKEGLGCNRTVPLKALFFLERSKEPSCEVAPEVYCVDRIFHQLLMPQEPERMLSLLSLTDRLIGSVPAYILRCDMTDASVLAAWNAVQKKAL